MQSKIWRTSRPCLRENGLRENGLRENGLRENDLRDHLLPASGSRAIGSRAIGSRANVSRAWLLVVLSLVTTVLSSCTRDSGDAHDESHHHHHHHHVAPHGGTLVVLGEEALHLEILLDAATGDLRVYVLDGEAEKSIRVAQPELALEITPRGDAAAAGSAFTETLSAVASALTGETVGDSSEFHVQSSRLKGLSHFEGKLGSLQVQGQTFTAIEFPFPEGNEAHGHDH